MALVRMHGWACSPEPSLFACLISTFSSWAGLIVLNDVRIVYTRYDIKLKEKTPSLITFFIIDDDDDDMGFKDQMTKF